MNSGRQDSWKLCFYCCQNTRMAGRLPKRWGLNQKSTAHRPWRITTAWSQSRSQMPISYSKGGVVVLLWDYRKSSQKRTFVPKWQNQLFTPCAILPEECTFSLSAHDFTISERGLPDQVQSWAGFVNIFSIYLQLCSNTRNKRCKSKTFNKLWIQSTNVQLQMPSKCPLMIYRSTGSHQPHHDDHDHPVTCLRSTSFLFGQGLGQWGGQKQEGSSWAGLNTCISNNPWITGTGTLNKANKLQGHTTKWLHTTQ